MNIIIPIGGKGERFKKNGFNNPKPLINVLGKEIIFYVLDNLKLHNSDKIFIIYYNLENYNFEKTLLKKYPEIEFIRVTKQTKGASETLFLGLNEIIHKTKLKKCMILDCDTF